VFAPRVTRLDWDGCRDGVAVAHLRIAGGTHQWPGATPPDPGPPSTIAAADVAWSFLRDRRLAPPAR
jgi:poly(3-hydroxybutyrate) depolymerase